MVCSLASELLCLGSIPAWDKLFALNAASTGLISIPRLPIELKLPTNVHKQGEDQSAVTRMEVQDVFKSVIGDTGDINWSDLNSTNTVCAETSQTW